MSTRWIVELDYTADADLDVDAVRQNLEDELKVSKGTPVKITNSTFMFDHIDDAFNVRMRFGEHVVSVERHTQDEIEREAEMAEYEMFAD